MGTAMNEQLPEPMTPADCDLRGNDWMPLHGTRLFGSRFYSLARRNPRAGLAGIKLWWEAWMQCPAASLPSDDFDLADLAGFGEDLKAWKAAKEVALHGFVLCSDGRYYHKMLAEEAIKAFGHRLRADKKRAKDHARLQAWREKRTGNGVSETSDETQGETLGETLGETPNATHVKRVSDDDETHVKRVSSRVDKTGQDKTGQSKKEREAAASTEPPRERPKTAQLCRSDPPDRWAPHAEKWEIDREGVRRPVVNGDYLDITADLMLEAAGINDVNWRGDFRPLIGWMREGIDGHVIIEAVRQVASRPGYRPPASLAYFDKPVRERAGLDAAA